MADGAMSFSSIRTPKVLAGNHINAYSDVRQNPDNAVCIQRHPFDDFGRDADLYTVKTVSEMCPSDPSIRMDPEMFLRPSYHPYLNYSAIWADESEFFYPNQTDYMSNNASAFSGYDTASLGRDNYFQRNPRLQVPQQQWGDQNDFIRNQDIMNKLMRKRYNETRYKAHSGL